MSLRRGQLVDYFGEPCRVVMVNECRARLVPVRKLKVTISNLFGRTVTFKRSLPGFNVSVNSEIPILSNAQDDATERAGRTPGQLKPRPARGVGKAKG